jgi:heat shock protein HslJ
MIAPVLFAVLLVSCAYVGSGNGSGDGNGSGNGTGSGQASPSANPSERATPAGTWILTRGTTASGDISLSPGHPITLTIDAEKVGGHAACNIYGGTVAIDGDAIQLSAMSMTEMACLDETAMNAEAAYMSALDAVTAWARNGDQLILSGDGVELTFGLQPPVPDAEIVGTAWLLDTLIQGDAATTVLGEATLVFAADGTFIGSTGCRELTGSYEISGDAIDFSDVTPTGDCTHELRGQDGLVLDVLDGGVKASVDGSTLTLIGNDRQGLGYSAAPGIE